MRARKTLKHQFSISHNEDDHPHYHHPLTDFYGDGVTMAHMASRRSKNSSSGFGTVFGVYIPCVLNILGTIIFIRTPWIAAQAGLLASTGLIFLCVSCTTLTALSLSALATNTKISAGGPYAIVTQNLGPEVGGSVGILFYLGSTIAVSMEALGGIETLLSVFNPRVPGPDCVQLNYTSDCYVVEPLFPWDRQLLSIACVLVLGTVVLLGMKFVANTSLPILFVVIFSLALSIGSTFAFFTGSWDVPDIKPAPTPKENLFPSFEPDIDTGAETSFLTLISLFFPAVTGILGGSNRSGVLKDPATAIPYGTLWAIFTTTLMYLLVLWVFGCTISNEDLKADKLIAATVGYPSPEVVGIGIAINCFGAGLQSLAGAPELLKSMANDGHISFLNIFATDHEDDAPFRAIGFTIFIAAACCLAGNLDYITPIITMFFLAMYGMINLACFTLSILKSPGFRPRWNHYHWSSAFAGFILCFVLSFVISVLYAFISIFLGVGLYIQILSSREKKEWGDAVVGYHLEQATSNLLALSRHRNTQRDTSVRKLKNKLTAKLPKQIAQDLEFGESYDGNYSHLQGNNWRPQILLLCKLDVQSLFVTQPHLLDLAAQLKKGRGLIIAVAMIHGDVMHEGCTDFAKEAKVSLDNQLKDAGVKGFTDVCLGSGPDLLEPLRILIQSQGLGALSPNSVMLNWPDVWRESESTGNEESTLVGLDGNQEQEELAIRDAAESATAFQDKTLRHKVMFVDLLKSSLGCGKAVFVVKGTEGFPGNQHRLNGTIDVWLLMHDGGIVLLLSYLLQRHRVWRNCTLRIFVIAPAKLVDLELTKQNLLSHLRVQRIDAEVTVVPVSIADAMDLDRNRTVRGNLPTGHVSLIDESLFVQPTSDKVETIDEDDEFNDDEKVQWAKDFCRRKDYLASSLTSNERYMDLEKQMGSTGKDSDLEKPFVLPERDVYRSERKSINNESDEGHLHIETATHLNAKIRERSGEANLVIVNLPLSRSTIPTEFIDYTETLTSGLERVILIRGSGGERITEYDPNV